MTGMKDNNYIIAALKMIMPSDLKIDYSDCDDYFKKYTQLIAKPICQHYSRQIENLINYSDDDTILMSELFLGFHCKTCGHFESDHITCHKYIKSTDFDCATCGMSKSSHIICIDYSIHNIHGCTYDEDLIDSNTDNDDCINCGLSWLDHQHKYDQLKIDDCGTFTENPNFPSHCLNCIFNRTHHSFSKKYHSLNDKSKSKIIDNFHRITSEFHTMSETDRIKSYKEYYSIIQMITSSL